MDTEKDSLELCERLFTGLTKLGTPPIVTESKCDESPFVSGKDEIVVTDELIEAVDTAFQKSRKINTTHKKTFIFSQLELCQLSTPQAMLELINMVKSHEIYQIGKIRKNGARYQIFYMDQNHNVRSTTIPNKWASGVANSTSYANKIWQNMLRENKTIGYNPEVNGEYSTKVCHANRPREENSDDK